MIGSKSLKALLQPKSVAVIGASPRVESVAHRVIANLHRGGYAGAVLPVHPRHAAVQRIPCTRSVAELSVVPDLAILCTPAALAAAQLRELGERGVKGVVVIAADPDGVAAGTPFKADLRAAAQACGVRWFGPQAAGIQLPRLQLNASWIEFMPPPGRLALLAQSGALAASALSWAATRGMGFSSVFTVGDGVDVGVPELLDHLGEDGYTQAVLLHVERIADGREFIASARALARQKPVVVLWAGAQCDVLGDGRPTVKHDDVCRAAFHRSGLLQVSEIADWLDAGEILSHGRRQIGDRLAILCNGHGPAQLALGALAGRHPPAELAESVRTRLRALVPGGNPVGNPVNLEVDARGVRFESALGALAEGQAADAALAIVAPSLPDAGTGIAEAIAKAASTSGLPTLACWLGGRVEPAVRGALSAAGIPLFEAPERAVQAYLHLVRFRRSQESLRQLPEAGPVPSGAGRADLRLSDEAESPAYLRASGIVAKATFNDLPKIAGAEAAALLAAAELEVADPAPGPVVPLRITVGDDPVFGRAIEAAVGSRRRTLLPALNVELAARAATSLQAELRAFTAAPPGVDAIATALVRIADVLVGFPEIVGLAIPAFDWDGSRLRPVAPEAWLLPYERTRPHLAVHPYPREHETRITLRDGRTALVRPVRPHEDAPLLEGLLAAVSAEDRFLRYCKVIEGAPPDVVARMARTDYDREMVFVALAEDSGGRPVALGVVDAFVSPDHSEAEYSILLRSDLKGTGLGKALMLKIIDYCRRREVGRIFGLVLRKNRGMRGLATHLGFETESDPDDDMVEVSLDL